MSESSRPAAWACYTLSLLLALAAALAAWSPRSSPIPWFAPAILAVVAGTFGLTFHDADIQDQKLNKNEGQQKDTRK